MRPPAYVLNTNIHARYERTHGVHSFTTTDKTSVTVISKPSWEEYYDSLQALPRDTTGYVVSPELITTPAVAPIGTLLEQAYKRTQLVREVSTRLPDATLLLGTAYANFSKLYNSALHIENGTVKKRHNKFHLTLPERGFFQPPPLPERVTVSKDIGTLICADLIADAWSNERYFNTASRSSVVKRLFVLACWGVPTSFSESDDHASQCNDTLTRGVTNIFKKYPEVQEIIMADRALPDTGIAPYNAHFTRDGAGALPAHSV